MFQYRDYMCIPCGKVFETIVNVQDGEVVSTDKSETTCPKCASTNTLLVLGNGKGKQVIIH